MTGVQTCALPISVFIGVNAIVHGDIVAEKVEIYGEVLGSITAKKIICGATAKVRGDILHSTIHIENGAHVDGNCRKFIPIVYEPDTLLENQENLIVAEMAREPEIHQEEVQSFGATLSEVQLQQAQAEFESHKENEKVEA